MESRNRYKGIHPYAVNTVRHHARQLARSPGFLPDDLEDLEQEMMLHVHRQLAHHNPAKASTETFISRIVSTFTITLHRQAVANGVGDFQTVSLYAPFYDEDGNANELVETIPTNGSPWPDQNIAWHEAIDNRVDASRLLNRFPPSLRHIALLFMADPISTVSRSKGISRQAIYDAISRMRHIAGRAVKKYSDNSPTSCVCNRYEAHMTTS